VPTLTEVLLDDAAAGSPAAGPAVEAAHPGSVPAGPVDEARLAQEVLADVLRDLDLMFEARVREAVAPALARAADTLIREARVELAGVIRDAVGRAVAQAMARRRGPSR
jgi:hypothetical protein